MSQFHQVCVEHQAWDLTVGDLQVPGSSHSREWTGGVLDGPRKLEISIQISGEEAAQIVEGSQKTGRVDSEDSRGGCKGRSAFHQTDGEVAGGFSAVDVGFELRTSDET